MSIILYIRKKSDQEPSSYRKNKTLRKISRIILLHSKSKNTVVICLYCIHYKYLYLFMIWKSIINLIRNYIRIEKLFLSNQLNTFIVNMATIVLPYKSQRTICINMLPPPQTSKYPFTGYILLHYIKIMIAQHFSLFIC